MIYFLCKKGHDEPARHPPGVLMKLQYRVVFGETAFTLKRRSSSLLTQTFSNSSLTNKSNKGDNKSRECKQKCLHEQDIKTKKKLKGKK